MTAAAVALGVGVLGACTPEEMQLWQAWHAQDPAGPHLHRDFAQHGNRAIPGSDVVDFESHATAPR